VALPKTLRFACRACSYVRVVFGLCHLEIVFCVITLLESTSFAKRTGAVGTHAEYGNVFEVREAHLNFELFFYRARHGYILSPQARRRRRSIEPLPYSQPRLRRNQFRQGISHRVPAVIIPRLQVWHDYACAPVLTEGPETRLLLRVNTSAMDDDFLERAEERDAIFHRPRPFFSAFNPEARVADVADHRR